mmetsp:Transcript_41143/g.87089  ORF Transcript_41143/g.87089 Transcript_41143/m.87089 type:complete len:221 (+) Transcript_41143:1244-1906(+)
MESGDQRIPLLPPVALVRRGNHTLPAQRQAEIRMLLHMFPGDPLAVLGVREHDLVGDHRRFSGSHHDDGENEVGAGVPSAVVLLDVAPVSVLRSPAVCKDILCHNLKFGLCPRLQRPTQVLGHIVLQAQRLILHLVQRLEQGRARAGCRLESARLLGLLTEAHPSLERALGDLLQSGQRVRASFAGCDRFSGDMRHQPLHPIHTASWHDSSKFSSETERP